MRTVALLLAVFHGLNGIAMLAAPDAWYLAVPGVTGTGPANTHFIRDIGLAFLAAAAALLLWRRQPLAAILAPAALFLGGHAGLHLVEMVAHRVSAAEAVRDFATIVIPGFLPVWFTVAGSRS